MNNVCFGRFLRLYKRFRSIMTVLWSAIQSTTFRFFSTNGEDNIKNIVGISLFVYEFFDMLD